MRTGREETNQRSIIGAADATNGGAVVLGHGNNFTPTLGGNSTWALQVIGSEYRLTRVTSGGSSLDIFALSQTGIATISGANGSFQFNGSASSTSIEFRNNGTGALFMDWTIDASADRHFRFIQNTATDFQFTGITNTAYRTDRPWTFENTFTIGPANTAGFRVINLVNSAGSIAVSGNPTAARTQTLQDVSGTFAYIEVPEPIQSLSSTSLDLTTAGAYVRLTNITETTLTVPTNATSAHPIGTVIKFVGTNGWVSLAAAAGVTLNNRTPFPLALIPRGVDFKLRKVGTDEWDLTCDPWDPARVFVGVHDFMNTGSSGWLMGTAVSSGMVTPATGTNSNPGSATLSTSTSATGQYQFSTSINAINSTSGSGRWYFQANDVVVDAIPDGTNTYIARLGFMSTFASTTPNEAAFFSITTANSGNYERVIRDGGITTSETTSSSPTSARTMSILVRPGNLATFTIDGVSSSFGSAVISPVGAGVTIVKTVGTTARTLTLSRVTLIGELY